MMLLALVLCLVGLSLVEGQASGTPGTSKQPCQKNFIIPPPDIVNTCRNFNAQERKLLERQIEELQQQLASLSNGKAANFSASINPHFACDCEKNTSFLFAFQDCQEVATLALGVSGVYEITPVISTSQLLVVKDVEKSNDTAYVMATVSDPIKVYCDLHDDSLAWTVLMKRKKLNVSFDRTWNEYVKGFGDIESHGDFWIGLETMYKLTNTATAQRFILWIVLTDHLGVPHVVRFTEFRISSGTTGYRFLYDTASSTTSIQITNDRAFVAKDYDPYEQDTTTPSKDYYDIGTWKECVKKGTNTKGGGWWFEEVRQRYTSVDDCGDSNLNAPKPYWAGLDLKGVEMKIRPLNE